MTSTHCASSVRRPSRRLARNARVVVIGTDPSTLSEVAHVATQRALEGAVRSIGKELRHGATANLVLAQRSSSDGVRSAVEFLLSGRSAYVDGQVIRVDDASGTNPDPARPLAGKVAVVTGAARGIGAEIARVMARDGATVVAVDVPAAGDALAAVANEIRGTALQVDVTAADAGSRIVEHAVSRHGAIDIVVHNAGITRDKLLANMDESRWGSVIVGQPALDPPDERGDPRGRWHARRRSHHLRGLDRRHRRQPRPDQLRREQGGRHRHRRRPVEHSSPLGASPSTRWHPASSRPR